ncbi:MAG: FAD-dependent oxidoreductase [Actinomycetes bacterium]
MQGARARRSEPAIEVAIVGAGPYGLSLASRLRQAGVPFEIFGEPMGAWRHGMPEGMLLKSSSEASSIDGPEGSGFEEFVAAAGLPAYERSQQIPIDTFVDYGMWFTEHHVGGVRPEWVTRVATRPGGFSLELTSGETVGARRVVVASGPLPHAHLPEVLADARRAQPDLAARITHLSEHHDLSGFAGRRVAIVGAGQGAFETAALLHEAGAHSVTVLARVSEMTWTSPPRETGRTRLERLRAPESQLGGGWPHRILESGARQFRHLPASTRLWVLGEVLGPKAAWWLRDRLDGTVDIRTATVIREVAPTADGLRLGLAEGDAVVDTLVVDHVIAATGFHYDVDAIGELDPALRARVARVGGFPQLDGALESSVPGLHFTGLASSATLGPSTRFVFGSAIASPLLARAITRTARATARPLGPIPARADAELPRVARAR